MAGPRSHRARATSSLVLAAAVLAGCGGSSTGLVASRSAQQILAASRAAGARAATVHVAGTLASARGRLSLDLQLVAGKGGQGRIAQGDLDFTLIRIGRFVYLKGNSAFYRRLGGPVQRVLAGRWLKAKTSAGLATFASLTNLRELVDMTLTSHGKLARTGTGTVEGQKVVAIDDLARGGTLYVAAEGAPYPLQLRERGGGGGTLVFDSWNQPVTLTAPADAINVNQLLGR